MVFIHQKILAGITYEISKSDTEFLAACTQGADSSVLTEQYNSSIKAKPRTDSFKSSFMKDLYRQVIREIATYSSMISEDEWMKNPLKKIYKEKISRYHGMTKEQLCRRFGVKKRPKQLNFILCQKMLSLSGKSNVASEMELAGIIFRTITVDKNGRTTEGMPFKSFKFEELINVPREISSIRKDFVDLKMMIFVFKEIDGIISFDKFQFWNAPNSIVDGTIRVMHEKCAQMVRDGSAFILRTMVK